VADNEELCTMEILDDILGEEQDAEEQEEEQTRTGSTNTFFSKLKCLVT